MKKIIAMFLTLIMALSICVPAFATPELPPLPPMPNPEEIKGQVEALVNQKIQEKIDSIFIAMDDHLESNPLPPESDYSTEAEWEVAIKDWVNVLLISKAMSHKAAKVGMKISYNSGTFTELETFYIKQALQLYIKDLYDEDEIANCKELANKITTTYRLTADEQYLLSSALYYLPSELPQVSEGVSVSDAITNSLTNQAKMTDKQYEAVLAVMDSVPEAPVISIDVPQASYDLVFATTGEEVYKALVELGIPTKLMPKAIDILAERKILLDPVTQLAKKTVADHIAAGDTQKPTDTPEEEKPASGIQALLDKLFGKKDNATDGDSNNAENGMKDPTGDVAIFSVLGLAVAAGTALVITKKKKSSK